MPFDVEAPNLPGFAPPDPSPTAGDTPRHLALIVDALRGTLDVTVHGAGGGIANSFDLYLSDPDEALGLASSISFYAEGEHEGESRMIVIVGARPVAVESGR